MYLFAPVFYFDIEAAVGAAFRFDILEDWWVVGVVEVIVFAATTASAGASFKSAGRVIFVVKADFGDEDIFSGVRVYIFFIRFPI